MEKIITHIEEEQEIPSYLFVYSLEIDSEFFVCNFLEKNQIYVLAKLALVGTPWKSENTFHAFSDSEKVKILKLLREDFDVRDLLRQL